MVLDGLARGVNDDSDEKALKWAARGICDGSDAVSLVRKMTVLMQADSVLLEKIVSAYSTFVLALLLHPHVAERAQAEIDAVIGSDRLPSLSDRSKLRYVDAVLKETLRWNVVSPLGA